MGNFVFSIIKLLCAILILPIAMACATTLYDHLPVYPYSYSKWIISGGTTFLLLFLFFYRFSGIHETGRKMSSGMLSLLSPLNELVSKTFSFYLILILPAFWITKRIIGIDKFDNIFLFAIGFFFIMHLVSTAQELQNEEASLIKPNCLLMINLNIILNVLIIVFVLDATIDTVTYMQFIKNVWAISERMYLLGIGKIVA